MKKLTRVYCFTIALLLLVLFLVGCAGNTNAESEKENDKTEENNLIDEEEDEPEPTTGSEEASSDDDNNTSSDKSTNEEPSNNTYEDDNASGNEEDNPLSEYSSEEIEYARVWLQLGVMKDVDELNVRHIPAGTALNSDDETSASYPEDVFQLAGARLVAGSVTYSGNGDGTINVYNVPLRWDGEYPAGEEFYEDIIENTELEYIDTGDDEEIIELIDKMNIH
ncbi:hypothetical protein J2Z83_003164 [Virgibacillus natechei]|uniref:Lipoprotein n=1 Tax=Virgibacillus natechei TaxID=1216297 RepID=A0ABS4IJ90_9BACI|nr:hypothetical protein [Virgibacillus natechei]MBP1971027.1 hypothetical protein [Virgibacillus natechei]UZD12973.1 hypothetical protein OLD84_19160 [Virgibacillus natechei]